MRSRFPTLGQLSREDASGDEGKARVSSSDREQASRDCAAEQGAVQHAHLRGWRRHLCNTMGAMGLVLALLGAILPIMPTTPFLLLAAACFLRSSPRLHARLIANPTFGPYIEQWQCDHTLPRRIKRRAYLLLLFSFSISLIWIEPRAAKIGVALFGLLLTAALAAVPCTRAGHEVERLR